jgi:WD40 repeat protein
MQGVAPQKMTLRAWCTVLIVALASLPWHPGLTTARERVSAAPTDSGSEVAGNAADATDLVAAAAKLEELVRIQQAELIWAAEALSEPVQQDVDWATAKSPNGRYSITRRGADGVYLHDAITNQQIDMSEYRILTVAFSPDSERFATGGADRTVRLWSSSTGELQKTFREHAAPVHSVAFIHQGQELVSASNDGLLMCWKLAEGIERSSADCPHTPANCLAVSPDGRWLAIGTGSWMKEDGGKIVIWDLASMSKSVEFSCTDPVGVLMFRPDSQTLAAGDYQGRVTFWDVPVRKRLGATLPRYKNAIAAARFSLDTQALASVTTDEIYREPPPQIPNSLRWFFDRAADLPRRTEPLASGRIDRSASGTIQQDAVDFDRIQRIRQRIHALEEELGPTEEKPDDRVLVAPLTQ